MATAYAREAAAGASGHGAWNDGTRPQSRDELARGPGKRTHTYPHDLIHKCAGVYAYCIA
jgi:hypothetical protein